ncbi:MAG: hypothetical protein LUG96_01465 [Tannerellaceae bacterium]|nr:hypothetical protein [Tannerellaceae bacterium]
MRRSVTKNNYRTPEIGDYVFSDGTWSSTTISGKTVVGYCYYVNEEDRRLLSSRIVSNNCMAPDIYTGPADLTVTANNVAGYLSDMDGRSNSQKWYKANGSYAQAVIDCYNYSTGIFDDWYLPSIGELYTIYSNSQIFRDKGLNFYVSDRNLAWQSSSRSSSSYPGYLYTIWSPLVNGTNYTIEGRGAGPAPGFVNYPCTNF